MATKKRFAHRAALALAAVWFLTGVMHAAEERPDPTPPKDAKTPSFFSRAGKPDWLNEQNREQNSASRYVSPDKTISSSTMLGRAQSAEQPEPKSTDGLVLSPDVLQMLGDKSAEPVQPAVSGTAGDMAETMVQETYRRKTTGYYGRSFKTRAEARAAARAAGINRWNSSRKMREEVGGTEDQGSGYYPYWRLRSKIRFR